MNKKSVHAISRLWKKTSFHCLLESSQEQLNFMCQRLDRIMSGYNTFQRNVLSTMKQLRTIRLQIPALSKLKQGILKNRLKLQQLIHEEADNIKVLINQLSQFKYVLQKSEVNALKEYHLMMDYFINQIPVGVSVRKIQEICDSFRLIDVESRRVISKRVGAHQFEKWMADFSVRSQTFFQKAYSPFWQKEAKENHIPFVRVKSAKKLDPLCFESNNYYLHGNNDKIREIEQFEVEQQQKPLKISTGKIQDQMQEEQGDIVSQIYKQIEKLPKKKQYK